MNNLTNYLPFVNEQIAFHAKLERRWSSSDPKRTLLHQTTREKFEGLGAAIEGLASVNSVTDDDSRKKPVQLALGFDDVDGLPPELLEELTFTGADRNDYAVIKAIEDCGGVASLDRILIGLFRATGEVHKRTLLTSRIYRMTQRGQLFSVPSRKGIYSLRELSEEESAALT